MLARLQSECSDNEQSSSYKDQVREIRARFAAGAAKKALARAYGVTPRTIRDLLTGKTWRAVS